MISSRNKRNYESLKKQQEVVANLRLLFDVMIDVKTCFEAWQGLYRSSVARSDHLIILKRYPHFFQTIDRALFCSLIVGIYKVYDTKNSKISLLNLLRNAQKHKLLKRLMYNKLFRKIVILKGGVVTANNFKNFQLKQQKLIDDLILNGYLNSAGVIQNKFDVLLQQEHCVGKMKSNYLQDSILKAQIIEVIKIRRDILKKIDYLRHNYYAHLQTHPKDAFDMAGINAADIQDIVDGTIAIINDLSRAITNGTYSYDFSGVQSNLNAILTTLGQVR